MPLEDTEEETAPNLRYIFMEQGKFMKYDFDTVINRKNTGSFKWDDISLEMKAEYEDIIMLIIGIVLRGLVKSSLNTYLRKKHNNGCT